MTEETNTQKRQQTFTPDPTRVYELLKTNLGEQRARLWGEFLQHSSYPPIMVSGQQATVYVANSFVYDWLRDAAHQDLIAAYSTAIRETCGSQKIEIKFELNEECYKTYLTKDNPEGTAVQELPSQKALSPREFFRTSSNARIGSAPLPREEPFTVGPWIEDAYDLLHTAADKKAPLFFKLYPRITLSGPRGTGKTALLGQIARQRIEQGDSVGYFNFNALILTLLTMARDYKSQRGKNREDFFSKLLSETLVGADLLILDNIGWPKNLGIDWLYGHLSTVLEERLHGRIGDKQDNPAKPTLFATSYRQSSQNPKAPGFAELISKLPEECSGIADFYDRIAGSLWTHTMQFSPEKDALKVEQLIKERLQARLNPRGISVGKEVPGIITQYFFGTTTNPSQLTPRTLVSLVDEAEAAGIRRGKGSLIDALLPSKFLPYVPGAVAGAFTPFEQQVTVEDVIEATARVFGITRTEIAEGSRRQHIVRPRQTVFYIAELLGIKISKGVIAKKVGGITHHTTGIYAARRIRDLKARDPTLREKITQIIGSLGKQEAILPEQSSPTSLNTGDPS